MVYTISRNVQNSGLLEKLETINIYEKLKFYDLAEPAVTEWVNLISKIDPYRLTLRTWPEE